MSGKRKTGPEYTKEQLAASGRYRDKRDLVCALLKSGRRYSLQEADAEMGKYEKGAVK